MRVLLERPPLAERRNPTNDSLSSMARLTSWPREDFRIPLEGRSVPCVIQGRCRSQSGLGLVPPIVHLARCRYSPLAFFVRLLDFSVLLV